MDDCDIFREQLATTYPRYGHALWNPSPTRLDRPVEVGDVGFIRWGTFHRFFNALLPADDPSHELGLPDGYKPLAPSLSNHINRGLFSSGHYCSDKICVESVPGYHDGPNDFPKLSFLRPGKQKGAVLFLPVDARREDTIAQGDFGKWIIEHIDSLFNFAKRFGFGIEQMEQIILVTGCDRATSSINVAFLGNHDDARVSFRVGIIDPDGPNASINFQFQPGNVQGAVLNHGPQGTDLLDNQCVFVRGFRVARTFRILPKHLKAAAGSAPDPEGDDGESEKGLVSIPAATQYQDPLQLLLSYAVERATDCDMVLVHDDDLQKIVRIESDTETSLDIIQPDVMMELFYRPNIDIDKSSHAVSTSTSDPNTDIVVGRVAKFSVIPKNLEPDPPQGFGVARELPLQMPDVQPYSGGRDKRRALIIGINYTLHPDPRFRLRYCVEDAYAMANLLDDNLGFARKNIRVMTDEYSPTNHPTKKNILREMAALVHDAQPHDSFFIYFSGHAIQVKDLDGDESDGLDECLCAMDYLGNEPHPHPGTPGLIADDVMHEIMVRPLPEGCRLTAIFDSCHSGTLLDLPYLYNAQGVAKEFRHRNRLEILRGKSSYADVVSLGATKDALETGRGGALRRAFIECLKAFRNGLKYKELIQYLREDMISRAMPQQPLLSSSHEIDTDLPFVI